MNSGDGFGPVWLFSPVETEGGAPPCPCAAASQMPARPSGKVKVELSPELPALEAARRILLTLHGAIKANEEGLRADADPEFLHDYRVAVRRTRSALGQLKAELPPSVMRFRAKFLNLGLVTGPTRDLDVHLIDFPRYRDALPPGHRDDLAPLLDLLLKKKKEAHAALLTALDSESHRKFSSGWEALLKKALKPSPKAPSGGLPVGEVAGARIHKLFKKALRQGRALGEASPPEAFHELRKTCKKLRYLIEFFQSLYPPGEIRGFVAFLKSLQDNLGEFQDIQVQKAALRGYADELWKDKAGAPACLVAIGMLLEKLELREGEVRREFEGSFDLFSGRQNRRAFKALFAPPAVERGGLKKAKKCGPEKKNG